MPAALFLETRANGPGFTAGMKFHWRARNE
jgi:hypothetical protein